MDNRAWSSGASASPPAAPASPSVGYPTPGDPLTATPATKGGAYWFHQLGEELRAIQTAAGITPDHTSLTQLLTALRSAGVFTTPAQFDNTTKAATTEFVQRALGSLSGFTSINVNVTLTAAHAGRGCYFSAAAIATLPLANAVPAGTLIYFSSFTTGATSVARQGADTIAASSGSSALTSMVLLDGEDLILESNGNTQWIAVGGSARLKYAASFGASLAANGYQKLPSGLILQWGSGTASGTGPLSVNFPIAFPTQCYGVIASINTNNARTIGATPTSSSAFSIVAYGLGGAYAVEPFAYLAVGK